jgi:thiopurine S-methyltransferase
MQPQFWLERWRTGQIAFHQSSVDRSLRRHWPSLGVAAGNRVFAPLCGKSLDLLWLRDQGLEVLGVELAAAAVESFFLENGLPARRRAGDPFDVYDALGLRLLCGDFFALTPALLGRVDAVYDRAALISWTPALRDGYVEHLAKLMSPGTPMLLITLEYPQSQMPGPPFAVPGEEVARLYSAQFDVREIARQDILPHEARLRAKGLTELFEVCYRLVLL